MTDVWKAGLLEPISAEAPCGQNLEDAGELAKLEAYQIFGQETLEPPPKDSGPARPGVSPARATGRRTGPSSKNSQSSTFGGAKTSGR
jgi:hypothetical protein